MVVVDGQVVDILHGYNDQVYAFLDSDGMPLTCTDRVLVRACVVE